MSTGEIMSTSMVKTFKKITNDDYTKCGGKAAVLAQLWKRKFPVPNGLVIFPQAFSDEELLDVAWDEIKDQLERFRNKGSDLSFAVRSSAMSEDSVAASFAGEFDTVLDLSNDDQIYQAIHTVYRSKDNARVQSYSQHMDVEAEHQMAVIIQIFVKPRYAGVLFTADPLNGDRYTMVGNYSEGSADALVSGEITPQSFRIQNGTYQGPDEFSIYYRDLLKLAEMLVEIYEYPQDIEWAISDKLYILQSRPITSLQSYNPETGEHNDSYQGNFLWANSNVAEALPEVMTPSTSSAWHIFHHQMTPFSLPDIPLTGNIAGRCYANFSAFYSFYRVLIGEERARFTVEELLGTLPEGLEIPYIPINRWTLVRMLPSIFPYAFRLIRNMKNIPRYLESNPQKTAELIAVITQTSSSAELLELWKKRVKKHMMTGFWMLRVGVRRALAYSSDLRRELIDTIGVEDTNTIFSNMSGDDMIRSLGPLMGLVQLEEGVISREEYIRDYGFRGPNELELYIDDDLTVDERIEKMRAEIRGIDVKKMRTRQQENYEQAISRLREQYPEEAPVIMERLASIAVHMKTREATRSESVRSFTVLRQFYRQAGTITGLNDKIFFLSIDELLDVLDSREEVCEFLDARMQTYQRYKSLPPYPALISGRFDPELWIKNPNRRTDYAGPMEIPSEEHENIIKGIPGVSGRIKGRVRKISSMDESDQFLEGEILVANSTNVGWTILFPKASAIVTDIGAPLSHAAIVARELGIPCVVGCGDACRRLQTGDEVIVDGSLGIVEILG